MRGQPALALSLDEGLADARHERLAALFDAHEERLYRLARRLAATADDARDLVQETFLRAAKSLNSIPAGPGKEEAWLVRVLVNIRRDQWRSAAVRKRSAAAVFSEVSDSPSSPESALMTKQAIWAALDRLHPRRRAILIMHELEGMSVPAIASLVGLTGMTVRWNLSMARRDLRRILAPYMGATT